MKKIISSPACILNTFHCYIIIYSLLFLFSSTIIKSQWVQTNGPMGGNIWSLALQGTNLFAGTVGGGIYLSSNTGQNWAPINNGLSELYIHSLVVKGARIFAGTWGSGIYCSDDNGISWTTKNTGLNNYNIYCLLVSGENIFAGSYGAGVFLSTDNGESWKPVNNGLTNLTIQALASKGSNLFAGTYNGLFISSDNGTSWTPINNGLVNKGVYALAVSGQTIFAGTGEDSGGGLYYSNDDGANWKLVEGGEKYPGVWSLTVSGSNVFVGMFYGYGGVLLCSNNNGKWTIKNTSFNDSAIWSLVSDNSKVFAGTSIGVFLSSDNGATWIPINNGIKGVPVSSIYSNGKDVFAGTNSGVFVSTDSGYNWSQSTNLLNRRAVSSLIGEGNFLFAGLTDDSQGAFDIIKSGGVFLSTDKGFTWNSITNNLPATNVLALATVGTNIYAGTDFYYDKNWNQINDILFHTSDNGQNWQAMCNGIKGDLVYRLATSGTNLFAGTWNGLYKSTNYGLNWQRIDNHFRDTVILSITSNNNYVFVSSGSGLIYRCNKDSINWKLSNIGIPNNSVFSLAAFGDNIFAGMRYGLGEGSGGLYVSPDNGITWKNVGMEGVTINAISIDSNYVYVGTDGMSIWRRPLSELTYYSVATSSNPVNGGNTVGAGFYIKNSQVTVTATTNVGYSFVNWTENGAVVSTNKSFSFSINANRTLIANFTQYQVKVLLYDDFNDLNNWNLQGNPSPRLISSIFNRNGIFDNNGGENGSFATSKLSFDVSRGFILESDVYLDFSNPAGCWAGASISMGIQNFKSGEDIYFALEAFGNTCTGSQGYSYTLSEIHYLYMDNNIRNSYWINNFADQYSNGWHTLRIEVNNLGYPKFYIDKDSIYSYNKSIPQSILSQKMNIWLGDHSSGIAGKAYHDWIRLSEPITTNIVNQNKEMPKYFSLEQNYPNPFNPVTTIDYSIPQTSFVSIKIYDMLGMEIITLVNEEKSAGNYKVKFNAGKFSSGLYLCRLQAGNFSETKKLILLK